MRARVALAQTLRRVHPNDAHAVLHRRVVVRFVRPEIHGRRLRGRPAPDLRLVFMHLAGRIRHRTGLREVRGRFDARDHADAVVDLEFRRQRVCLSLSSIMHWMNSGVISPLDMLRIMSVSHSGSSVPNTTLAFVLAILRSFSLAAMVALSSTLPA